MDNKLTKADNRGQFMKQQFSVAGGVAPTDEILTELFNPERKDRKLTRQELSKRIVDYFKTCIDEIMDESGSIEKVWKKPPTKSGFCLYLGISQRTLSNYLKDERSDNKPFNTAADEHNSRIISTSDFDLIHRAVAVIESFYEDKLSENRNVAGVIFWLNNLQNPTWSNEQAISFDVKTYGQQEDDKSLMELPDLLSMIPSNERKLLDEGTDEETTDF